VLVAVGLLGAASGANAQVWLWEQLPNLSTNAVEVMDGFAAKAAAGSLGSVSLPSSQPTAQAFGLEVPEPSVLAIAGFGLAALLLRRRRRRWRAGEVVEA
jgi:hypothetical protein